MPTNLIMILGQKWKLLGILLLITNVFASPALEGFNVIVKDLTVAGKNVQISPFAGIGVVSISLCFKNAGEKLSPKHKEALVSLLTRFLGEATATKTHEQLQDYSRKQNIHVSFASDGDHFMINGRCTPNKLAELINFIKELLLQARFNDADLNRFKKEMVAGLSQAMQSPDMQLSELVKEVICGHHAYGTSSQTYLASLKNITTADFKPYMQDCFTGENLIISACGEFDEAELQQQLELLIVALPKNFKATPPTNIEVVGPYKTHSRTFPVPQTVLSFWHKGIGLHHPDFFALHMAVRCLADPSVGFLSKKVRDEKGLTYHISAGLEIQEHLNRFVVSASTQTANVGTLMDAVHEVFADVYKNGLSPELVKNIKQSFIGNYKRSFNSSSHISTRLMHHQLADRPVDYHKIVVEKIEALTPEQINEAFKKFLNPEQFVIFTVGQ